MLHSRIMLGIVAITLSLGLSGCIDDTENIPFFGNPTIPQDSPAWRISGR